MGLQRVGRRFLVVANYLVGFVLIANYGLVARGLGLPWLRDVTEPVFLLLLLSRIPLFSLVSRATGLFSKSPDERQQAQRNRIYALSYQTLIVLVCLCLIGWAFLLKYPVAWFMPDINRPPWVGYADQFFVFLLVVTDTVLFLPVALVAWLEPDPPAEEVPAAPNA